MRRHIAILGLARKVIAGSPWGCRTAPVWALALCVLAGCGSDVKALMAQNSELFWDGEQTIATADETGRHPELVAAVYRTEAAKEDACQFIMDGATERMEQKDPTTPALWDGFVSDLGQLIALLVPIPMVENCAAAQAAYRKSLDDLRQRLDAEEAAQPSTRETPTLSAAGTALQ